MSFLRLVTDFNGLLAVHQLIVYAYSLLLMEIMVNIKIVDSWK